MLSIASLNHRVAICTSTDVVISSGTITIAREDVYHAWAKIENKQSSSFSREGFSIQQPLNRQTHLITIRYRRDIDISAMAWLYEERLQSGARWFKVLGVKDQDSSAQFITLSCRLVERGDDLVPPTTEDTKDEAVSVRKHGVAL